jgi:apolipoprotein N-acyltransferase
MKRRNTTRTGFGGIIAELGLLLAAAVLFALSFPSMAADRGFFPLGFFAVFPIFIVIHKSGWVRVFIYGLFFGFVSYALFNYWLLKFHPLAIFIVPVIYALYFLILFPALKIVDALFPRYGYIFQAVIWVAYEYIKSKGFLGYTYGIIGYSQYPFLPFIRISSIFGVWGVSLLVIYPSAVIGNALKKGAKGAAAFLKDHRVDLLVYAGVFIAAVLFGIASKADLGDSKKWRVALIQHNVDPWKHDYEDALNILIDLSRKAAEQGPEIVVWSETAFVPAVDYHTKYRRNRETYELVLRLKEFLAAQDVPYVIGNDDGVLKRVGREERIDYNAALLFEGGEITERYWKTHLVPFTENFPFEKRFPRIYKLLVEADTHFWEKGTEYTVFHAGGVAFSTPICFEDTFGYLSREFIRNGAEVIVNLTNDSWSYSTAAMMQHMSMAVFRAVENRRSVVRSTNGGITCIIDPNGRITARIPPFTEGFLVDEAVVYNEGTTAYTAWGDWFGFIMMISGFCILAAGGLTRILKYRKIKATEGDHQVER